MNSERKAPECDSNALLQGHTGHRSWRRFLLAGSFLGIAGLLLACSGGGSSNSTPTAPITYTIGGTVSGLSAPGLILQNNAGNDLAVSANGSFTFSKVLPTGAAYAVSVKTQPASSTEGQTCAVSSGSGTVVSSNVTTVTIACTTTVINGINVPPDPGVAGTATVAGIDTDKNGIRDDIDRFIATRYGANATSLKAGRTAALAWQHALTADVTTQAASRVTLQNIGDAGICAGQDFESAGMSVATELDQLYAAIFNTAARLDRLQAVEGSAGLFARSVTTANCQ
jgi:hypothetical protein